MVLTKEEKRQIVEKYGRGPQDTGSCEVQIVALTRRIKTLSDHFEKNKKDLLTRRNFLRMIGRRRKLLNYLKKNDYDKYVKIVKEIGL